MMIGIVGRDRQLLVFGVCGAASAIPGLVRAVSYAARREAEEAGAKPDREVPRCVSCWPQMGSEATAAAEMTLELTCVDATGDFPVARPERREEGKWWDRKRGGKRTGRSW